jgi:hypothetical protein
MLPLEFVMLDATASVDAIDNLIAACFIRAAARGRALRLESEARERDGVALPVLSDVPVSFLLDVGCNDEK